MKKMKFWILISTITILALLLAGTNYYWYRALKREEETLKNALIPTLSNDYFTNQLALTNQAKIKGDYEYKKWQQYATYNDPWYQETIDTLYHMEPLDIPLINQNPDYPNGCEAAAATMLLNYLGIDITLEDFINNYLPMSDVYEKDGIRYEPNPAVSYAGNPADTSRGWGTFEPVIANAITSILKEQKKENPKLEYNIYENAEKYSLKIAANQLTNTFTPFLIWTTIDYTEAKDIYEWFSYDKKSTYTYPKNSHVVVITGVDENYYYINDPLKNEKNIPIEKDLLETSFDSLGRQLLLVEIYELPEDFINESNYNETSQ